MNLTTDPWIPALKADGSRDFFSLNALFSQASEVRDLAVRPHERVALMRLLICITQAALDGPEDEDDWEDCQLSIQPRVKAYLEQWRTKFELFGKEERFLQVSDIEANSEKLESNPMTKLDLSLATGNNPTLFDNASGEPRNVDPARVALSLLTFQCFSPGGRIGPAKWNGQPTPGNGSSNHAPCTPSCMIHGIPLGSTLLDTIHFNLLSKDLVADVYTNGWGKPVWEAMPHGNKDHANIKNATSTYLGRLAPISRVIQLHEGLRGMLLANGLEYSGFPAFREPTATVIQKNSELGLLPASTGRSLWRQLSAITIRRRASNDGVSGPLAIQHETGSNTLGLWVGALVTDKAKIKELVEAIYNVPPSMFGKSGRAAYEEGVSLAESSELTLKRAIKAYANELNLETPPTVRASQEFWTAVEQHVSALFDIAREIVHPDQIPSSPWGVAVVTAARDAYYRVCPHQTPRQMQAFSEGLRTLNFIYKAKK